ncbi:hypothetical protein AK812_SmicGene40295 [Symbiodinium microadriaticum]|uniref:Uncharacterized protein n=1 Tax=Symbiodinium microadriaticum TaxID=2951 RepID=A0A1Q9C909_SYMMI|nr:hypothetical protein AK812_SmicGene40295 [Symbiodinium microadriaticum]
MILMACGGTTLRQKAEELELHLEQERQVELVADHEWSPASKSVLLGGSWELATLGNQNALVVVLKVVQCSLDHCIFMVQEVLSAENDEPEQLGSPQAYLGVHVDDDDALLIGKKKWLFEVDIDKDIPDHVEATEAQKHDNMPDLQVEVSMSQQARHAYDNMLCTRLPLAWISSTGTFSTMLSPMAPAFLSQGLGLDVQKLAAYLRGIVILFLVFLLLFRGVVEELHYRPPADQQLRHDEGAVVRQHAAPAKAAGDEPKRYCYAGVASWRCRGYPWFCGRAGEWSDRCRSAAGTADSGIQAGTVSPLNAGGVVATREQVNVPMNEAIHAVVPGQGQTLPTTSAALEDGSVHSVSASVQQGSSSLTVVRWITRLNEYLAAQGQTVSSIIYELKECGCLKQHGVTNDPSTKAIQEDFSMGVVSDLSLKDLLEDFGMRGTSNLEDFGVRAMRDLNVRVIFKNLSILRACRGLEVNVVTS